MDKWFFLQVMLVEFEDVVCIVLVLMEYMDFDMKNLNCFCVVFGLLVGNYVGFYYKSGVGYVLLIDWLIKFDDLNLQIIVCMCFVFQMWKSYDVDC